MYTRNAHRARAIDQRQRHHCVSAVVVAVAHRPFCYAMRPCECEGRSATTQGRPIDETASDRDRVSEGAVGACSEFMGKTFQAAQLTYERFFTIDNSCNFFLYLHN